VKTLIAIPCVGTIPYEFSMALDYLIKGENVSILYKPNSLVYDSRNLISLTAIENKFDRVMWFDSDMVFNPDTLQTLHKDMDNLGCDVVTGLYVKRSLPTEPVLYDIIEEPVRNDKGVLERNIYPYMDYPKNAVFPVAGCGFGCVLTTTKILHDVWQKFGPAFTPYTWASEDISFCYRVNQIGGRIWCDSNVSCGHIGTYVYTEKDLKRGDEH